MLQEARNQVEGIGQGKELGTIIKVLQLHQVLFDCCSTIEGESELSIEQKHRNRGINNYNNKHLYFAPSQNPFNFFSLNTLEQYKFILIKLNYLEHIT